MFSQKEIVCFRFYVWLDNRRNKYTKDWKKSENHHGRLPLCLINGMTLIKENVLSKIVKLINVHFLYHLKLKIIEKNRIESVKCMLNVCCVKCMLKKKKIISGSLIRNWCFVTLYFFFQFKVFKKSKSTVQLFQEGEIK